MDLKSLLVSKGLSQSKLSIMAKINTSQLNQALNGKQVMFPGWRKRIAEVLEMDESELFLEYEESEGTKCQE